MINRYKLYYRLFLIVFWTEFCLGFISEELLPFLASARNAVFLLCDMLMLLLGALTVRKRGDLIVVGSYLLIAITSTLILNHESLMTFINGTRDFAGLLFAVPIVRWFYLHPEGGTDFRDSILKQLKFWLWLQAFCITWQFIRYGACDAVGGSMGNGSSGMVSMLIYLVSFFLLTRDWKIGEFWSNLRRNWVYVFLLYPTFLNETKVSLILIVAYFMLLIDYDRKTLIRLFFAIPFMAVFMVGMFNIYLSITGQEMDRVLSKEFFEEYFIGIDMDHVITVALAIQDHDIEIDPDDFWSVDIPRFAKFGLVLTPLQEDTGGGLLLGAGVGQFKGGTLVQETDFAAENQWLLNGSRPWLFFLLVQLGIFGILWWIGVAVYQNFMKGSKWPLCVRVQILVGLCLCIIPLYNDSLRIFNFCAVLAFFYILMRYFTGEPAEEGNLPENAS